MRALVCIAWRQTRATLALDRAVEQKFRERIALIAAANDERDFYTLKSLHYEKLKGKRSHQRSMRLNDQWRLIIELKREGNAKLVVVVSIEDYH